MYVADKTTLLSHPSLSSNSLDACRSHRHATISILLDNRLLLEQGVFSLQHHLTDRQIQKIMMTTTTPPQHHRRSSASSDARRSSIAGPGSSRLLTIGPGAETIPLVSTVPLNQYPELSIRQHIVQLDEFDAQYEGGQRGSDDSPTSSQPRKRTKYLQLQQFKNKGWRLRTFARLMKFSQRKSCRCVAYLVAFECFLYALAIFLYTHYMEHFDENEEEEQAYGIETMDYITVALVALYGTRSLALLVLNGTNGIHQGGVVSALLVDVIIWVANLACWSKIVSTQQLGEQDVFVYSIVGLLGGLQLNACLLVHTVLKPFVQKSKGVVLCRDDTVSCKLIAKIVDSSGLTLDQKNTLLSEMKDADYDNRRELDHVKFFQFSNRAMMWIERWSLEDTPDEENEQPTGMKKMLLNRVRLPTARTASPRFQELGEQLQFSSLVHQTDKEYLKVRLRLRKQTADIGSFAKSVDSLEEAGSDSVIQVLIRTTNHLVGGQGFRAFLLVVFVLSMSLTEYLCILFVGELLNAGLELAGNEGSGDRTAFYRTMIYLVVSALVNAGTYFISSYLAAKIVSTATARLEKEITRRVLYCSTEMEKDYSRGALSNAFSANLAKTEALWNELQYNLLFPLCSLTSAVVFLMLLEIGYAMFIMAAIPLIFLFQSLLGERATESSDIFTNTSSRLLGRFQNTVGIQKAANLYRSQNFLKNRMFDHIDYNQKCHFSSLLWGSVIGACFNTIGSMILTIVEILLAFQVAAGQITSGEFFSLDYFASSVIKPLEQLGLFSGRVAFYSGAINDIDKLLSLVPMHEDEDTLGSDTQNDGESTKNIKDDAFLVKPMSEGQLDETTDDNPRIELDSPESGHVPKKQVTTKALTVRNELCLDRVGFQYATDLPMVLKDVSATIPAGTYTCLFGKSGSGKSTILSLLEGFHQCTQGQITMDGADISSVEVPLLRQNLAVVFQDAYVMDATIFDNIAFGYKSRGDSKTGEGIPYSQEEVEAAAKDAYIHDFILSLPDQYDTIIGSEADIALSGGQIQRVCGLARALLRRPHLLILDEATSALDALSEQAVLDTVLALREKGTTTVSVSHHTITAVNADKILVLDQGHVRQTGTYEELVQEEGIFQELVKAGEEGGD